MITQEELKSILHYEPETGIFTRLVESGGRNPGSVAGWKTERGYIRVSFNKKHIMAHRLAWLYVHGVMPSKQIDHINNIRDDNRIANLREATCTENQRNQKIKSNSNSGLKGACFDKKRMRWYSRITIAGKQIHLGTYETKEQAHSAYNLAAYLYFGEYQNPG